MELLPTYGSAAFSGRGGSFPTGARQAAPILWRAGVREPSTAERSWGGRSLPPASRWAEGQVPLDRSQSCGQNLTLVGGGSDTPYPWQGRGLELVILHTVSLMSPLGGPGTPLLRGGGPGNHTGETFSLSRMQYEAERSPRKPPAPFCCTPALTRGHISSASRQTGCWPGWGGVGGGGCPSSVCRNVHPPYRGNLNKCPIRPPSGVREPGAGSHCGL